MAEFNIIVKGYIKRYKGSSKITSNCVYIKTKEGLKIIVDPGMDLKALMKGLKKNRIKKEKIDYVLLTHLHPDHALLSGIFKKSKIICGNIGWDFNGNIGKIELDSKEIKIIETPGHERFHYSIIIDSIIGKVCIAGDIWWFEEKEEYKNLNLKDLLYKKDDKAYNFAKLVDSRKKILEMCRWIIPGHGEMFEIIK